MASRKAAVPDSVIQLEREFEQFTLNPLKSPSAHVIGRLLDGNCCTYIARVNRASRHIPHCRGRSLDECLALLVSVERKQSTEHWILFVFLCFEGKQWLWSS
jgi:hypothetical protein